MKRNTQLFDLYWEDILVAKIMPYLSMKDCFNFRCASKTCLKIINMYFAKLKCLKLLNKGFSPHSFNVSSSTKCGFRYKWSWFIKNNFSFPGIRNVLYATYSFEFKSLFYDNWCRFNPGFVEKSTLAESNLKSVQKFVRQVFTTCNIILQQLADLKAGPMHVVDYWRRGSAISAPVYVRRGRPVILYLNIWKLLINIHKEVQALKNI